MLRKNLSPLSILLLLLIGVLFFSINCSEEVILGGGGDTVTTSTTIIDETTTTSTTETYVSTTLEATTTSSSTSIPVVSTSSTTVAPTTTTTEIDVSTTLTSTSLGTGSTGGTGDTTITTNGASTSTSVPGTTTTTAEASITTTTVAPASSSSTSTTTDTYVSTSTSTSTSTTVSPVTTSSTSTSTSTSTTTTTIPDTIPPANPSIAINPATPTNGDVTVTITYSGDSTVKQYKIGTGAYQSYTAQFMASENTIIYAKAQDAVGNWSNEVNYSITNIDKTAPTATVAYSTTAQTNGDVTATITPSETVTITNNGGLATCTFTANGSFTFEFVDTAGNTGTVTATVANIDKTSPTATVAYSTTDPTNGSVTATITPSEPVTISNNDGLTTYTFTANGSLTFEFKDSAGNTGSVTATVSNIDKTSPTATVAYSTTDPTNGSVTATITPSETVTITNNSGLTTYQFTANGSFTFNFTDTAGNTGSATATVSNIDKTPPADPSISTNPTTPTAGDVTVAITFSEDSEVKEYKIGIGSYQTYTASFTVSQDTTIYAKAQDAVGNWSGEASYSITNIDKGNVTVNINLITPTEYTINFGAFDGELDKNTGETLDVTATLDGATSWEWYLDGDSIGVTMANCSINSASYDPGPYSLAVFATKDGILYSGTIEFDIGN